MTTVRVMNHPFQSALQTRPRPVEVLPPIEVTTDRLCFRPLALADRSQVLAAIDRTRDALHARLPINRAEPTPESDDDLFTRWVETAIESDNNRTAWRRAAFLEDGTFVGCFNLIKIERGLDWRCDVNCWVDSALQRRGYAREGLEALLHFATADLTVGLGLHRVIGMAQPDNTPSIGLIESLGFKPTGNADLLDINDVTRTHLEYEFIDR